MGVNFRKITLRAARAQKRNMDFVLTTFTGRTDFLVRCSVAEIGLPSSGGVRFQDNFVTLNPEL
jgi:hypothetical protein